MANPLAQHSASNPMRFH